MSDFTILITGGCGFIGSNISIKLKEKYPDYHIVCLDNLRRRGSELNISRLKHANVKFVHGDVRNVEDLDISLRPDIIIDAAAEPSVLAGIGASLNYVINTNLKGTLHLLELATKINAKLIFLSTSRVYPMQYLEQLNYEETCSRFKLTNYQNLPGVSAKGINEHFLLDKARSIYGCTKLVSEQMIEEFREFFGLEYVINRCGVIAGPHQMGKVDQGVIALWVARHYWLQDIFYFGYGGQGKQVRDVLHIADLFQLIDYQIHHFEQVNGQTFNVGGGSQSNISLKELTVLCSDVTGHKVSAHSVDENRKGDIPLYITDNTKISETTGWMPENDTTSIVSDIFSWINKNEKSLKPILCQ